MCLVGGFQGVVESVFRNGAEPKSVITIPTTLTAADNKAEYC